MAKRPKKKNSKIYNCNCNNCGNAYTATRSGTKFCSDICRADSSNKKRATIKTIVSVPLKEVKIPLKEVIIPKKTVVTRPAESEFTFVTSIPLGRYVSADGRIFDFDVDLAKKRLNDLGYFDWAQLLIRPNYKNNRAEVGIVDFGEGEGWENMPEREIFEKKSEIKSRVKRKNGKVVQYLKGGKIPRKPINKRKF